ncbi:unnamed protein product [Blumeria hordei]|uniref:Major facilitator superfamily (MFS) profile domain-containing protein n=2 Tax=Blumeria hordei TaxID=2867405 RepID=A0A383UQK3_BLUHO|nr:transporter [Blumeria hordei DH14]SZF02059.1 unnamed protein product [Blumeria hordei]
MQPSSDLEKTGFSTCNTQEPKSRCSTADPEKDDQKTSSYNLRTSFSSSSLNNTALSPERILPCDIEAEGDVGFSSLSCSKTAVSLAPDIPRHPSFEVKFDANGEKPQHWPLWYRILIIAAVSFASFIVVIHGTAYTRSMPGMIEEFELKDLSYATLGMSSYLLGISAGSLVMAPLSEVYGRKVVYIGSLFLYSVFIVPCALATTYPQIIVMRFLGAFVGSVTISNTPGTISDIFDEKYRALALSSWSLAPLNGPVVGPLIGGFVAQYLGWRWIYWLLFIMSVISWFLLIFVKETYVPVLLQRKAARIRKETGDDRWWCQYDEKLSMTQVLKASIPRPIILAFTEPILWLWNAYMSITYAILYLSFIAYPLIFVDLRGWSQSIAGLAFLGTGVGNLVAILGEPLFRRIINSHRKDPETGQVPLEASISILCIASILCPLGQIWFSCTALPINIHWIWPVLAGIPFGAGNCLAMIYSTNYLSNSYGIYAASAIAGNIVMRNVLGGLLPLSAAAMYAKLGPQWAGTLLGILEIILIPVPFVFYKWGRKIREKSSVISRMQLDIHGK